jgi:hypothetical protein
MSGTPFHLRDINNPPPYLDESQQRNWIKTAIKAKKNIKGSKLLKKRWLYGDPIFFGYEH